ncbi:MAG TPA: deoxyhypusine synthase family protein [Patescibacteria group bacterium]|nr:deoxyhypusine synthase family protein [Patescibacteria group bacterium]
MKKRDEKTAYRDRKPGAGTGYCDGFEPLKSLDLSKVNDFDDLARSMSHTAFGGRRLGEAVDVLYNMVTDPNCFVVGTFSGAMTPAKMGLLICDMIDMGMLNAVVSTGALMTHGLVEGYGMTHFKYKPGMDDKTLYQKNYNRIYDILELEKNLDDLEEILEEVFIKMNPKEIFSSYRVTELIGKHLDENMKGRSILKSAYRKKIPVYIPAFTDSELGLDFGLYNRGRIEKGKKPLAFNPFNDLEHFTEIIQKQKTMGIFTIGGGVPRNWAQQVGPYVDLIHWRLKLNSDPDKYFELYNSDGKKSYKYALRICPEPVEIGGLSGCTYSEGVSWGKFIPPEEGGMTAEVLTDATIAWPIVLKAVMERLKKNKVKIKKKFKA